MDYDVLVVGGGHAGCEAAHAAARSGSKTILLTQNLDTIGQMSCNPAIGGLGKGHLVREVDALGGLMGRVADAAGIQFRMLNRRKGPAVRGPRAQMDKIEYRRQMRWMLESTPNLQLRQGEVLDFIMDGDRLLGVITDWGEEIRCRSIVLTTGTFLAGLVHMGSRMFSSGRLGDAASEQLSRGLRRLNLPMGRLKTGTPPRLDGRTIDWSRLLPQYGDTPAPPFSFLTDRIDRPQMPCHVTHTNTETHRLIRENLHRAPLYSGQITGIGPRYCPSIEDKVVRFSERDSHQIFLEPEGRHTHEIYPNGISTSLPVDVQWALVRSMEGLEQVQIIRPGYAIEYDMVDPRALNQALAVKDIPGLYLAGQINGTTGYEEAAALGLVAGINASRWSRGLDAITFDRSSSYIGVMVDDLTSKGVDEPYRMFTSRAEFRLLLRADNADLRLTPIGREVGLIDDERWERFQIRKNKLDATRNKLQTSLLSQHEVLNLPSDPRGTERKSAWDWLRREEIEINLILRLVGMGIEDADLFADLEVEAKYQGYLKKQQAEINRFQTGEHILLPADIHWESVAGLTTEAREKLKRVAPNSLGQAYRIPGITPAAITAIRVFLKSSGR
ncbi:MAG: tRNA uridine-5-carboxymethylaminomethyl(34) synthesis enzyme MnmG [Magnetococcus sp. DMHC-6]